MRLPTPESPIEVVYQRVDFVESRQRHQRHDPGPDAAPGRCPVPDTAARRGSRAAQYESEAPDVIDVAAAADGAREGLDSRGGNGLRFVGGEFLAQYLGKTHRSMLGVCGPPELPYGDPPNG
ncbi:hypothetical protein [Embleya sp. AB8]|uniref:hypothetical protein n=1 Tax=Embleya sp. AB8 TaxID=3156304 RepID=UPI003C74704A